MKKIILFIVLISFMSSCRQDKLKPPVGTDECEAPNVSLTDISHAPISVDPPVIQTTNGNLQMQIPPDNALTIEGIELGRFLFYEKLLSGDGTMACGSCHELDKAFTDGNAKSLGIDGFETVRSSMSLINIGFQWSQGRQHNFGWDGKFYNLEDQAIEPVQNELEMHADWEEVECKIRSHADYPTKFRKAFADIEETNDITREHMTKAIAQFLRTLVSTNSRYDQFIRGEINFTDDEEDGFDMFFGDSHGITLPGQVDVHCEHCHGGANLGGYVFHNNGLDEAADLQSFADQGLGGVTGIPGDNGKFKAPSLRNIALTAPYMHDGRFNSLEDVITHYDTGGKVSPNSAEEMGQLSSQAPLTAQQKTALLAFLNALTDDSYFEKEEWKSPF